MTSLSPRARRTAIATSLLLLGAAACDSGSGTSAAPVDDRHNIVFVLTDDLSMNLVQYMPHVTGLAKSGTTFENYTVTDSLCCPSRSSILTGKFPRDAGVFTNGGK